MDLFERVLAYADTWGPLIPVGTIAIIFRKQKMPSKVVVILGYLLLCVLTFGTSNYLADRHINNMFLYHGFALEEFVLLSFFFNQCIAYRIFKKLHYWIIAFLTGCVLFNAMYLQGLKEWNGNILVIEFLILVVYCFIFYFELVHSDAILSFTDNGEFWIVSGIFIYCAGCLAIVAFYNFAYRSSHLVALSFWEFSVIMYLVKQGLITRGILCFRVTK